MKLIKKLSAVAVALAMMGAAQAVPVLQIGAPAGAGDTGTYADYQANTTNPTETDTAIISSGTLYVAGVYGPNTVYLGGDYGGGADYSDFGLPTSFDAYQSILMVSVPDGSLASALGSLLVNGSSAFYSSSILDSLFPNNHDPLKDAISDFLFFGIDNFDNNENGAVDFATETDFADGEILTVNVTGFGDLAWAHFDAMALETNEQGQSLRTTWEVNPASHDVTWKSSTGGPPSTGPVPEPGTITLLGAGILASLFYRRRVRQTHD